MQLMTGDADPNTLTQILNHHCCSVLLCIETLVESRHNKKDLPVNSLLFCQVRTCLLQLKQTIVNTVHAEYKSAQTPNEQTSAVKAAANTN